MDQNMLLFIAAETASGLQPLKWVDRLIGCLEERGVTTGWLFQDERGNQLRMSAFEEEVFGLLEDIQAERPDLIAPELEVREDFGLARSFRRGATTRAQNAKVDKAVIDYINRWKEGRDGDTPYFQGGMRVHYADQRQMAETLMQYSLAL
jgi:hypothetical protein